MSQKHVAVGPGGPLGPPVRCYTWPRILKAAASAASLLYCAALVQGIIRRMWVKSRHASRNSKLLMSPDAARMRETKLWHIGCAMGTLGSVPRHSVFRVALRPRAVVDKAKKGNDSQVEFPFSQRY